MRTCQRIRMTEGRRGEKLNENIFLFSNGTTYFHMNDQITPKKKDRNEK
jgi:hypothetical protein